MTWSPQPQAAERPLHQLCFSDDATAGTLVRQFVEAFWASRRGELPPPVGRVEVRIHFQLDGEGEGAHADCRVHLYISDGALHLGQLAGLAMASADLVDAGALPPRARVILLHDPSWDRA